MTTQANQLLTTSNGRLDGQALYTVWGGANDLFAAVKDPFNMSRIVADSVGNQAALVNALSQAGARYILVPNIPDLGMTPEFSGSPISAGIATLLSDSYNQAFTQQLATSSANIIPLNVSALLHEVAADPQAYGFSNGEAISHNGSSSNSRLDGTQAGWKLGVDKRMNDWTAGAYLSYEDLDGKTANNGSYSQKRQSAGLYGRWQASNLWFNAQLFYSDLDNKTRRHLRLGAATREHQAKAGGSQYGGKISTGYDWQVGTVTHGPLLSLSLQKAKINSLSEDGQGLSTSMGFDAQDQTSVQSGLGYQINVALSNQWAVYASAEWLHEFKKPAKQLGAHLQDGVYNNRQFYLPTDQKRVRDTGLLELGTMGQLSNNWTLGAGISAQVGKSTNAQTAVHLNTAYRF
uniref:Autotransporter domain-containing protein n=1 Tax=Steinernema glaseri TaxID=37863 RepID=A0A1I7Y3L1_9BILA